MCDFISWKTHKGKLYFLTDDIVKLRLREFKQYNEGWKGDLLGHGAIDWFFNLPENCGVKGECTDFSSPKNFPKEIVLAIKECRMNLIGFNLNLLNDPARKEYNKIKQTAWKEYDKIKQTARKEYDEITQTAQKEYEKIRQATFRKEYNKMEQTAWEKYDKIGQTAWEKYDKIRQTTFQKLFSNPKNRTEAWK